MYHISDTQDWMTANMLKFNGDKIAFMVIGTRQLLKSIKQGPHYPR